MKVINQSVCILEESEKFEDFLGDLKLYTYDIYLQKIGNGKYKILKSRIGDIVKNV